MIDKELQNKLQNITYLLNKIAASAGVIKTNSGESEETESQILIDLGTAIGVLNDLKGYGSTDNTNIADIKTNTTNIYNLLNDRLLNRVVLSRADYDALVNGGTVDADTLYYVIESQSN